ncbi:MAG: family 78 glycoside hydrolase catalytic domain [Clostridia bacterium]|nr:family 78 glycoside hydrolase catalytic domain [Clostridia bacterium]
MLTMNVQKLFCGVGGDVNRIPSIVIAPDGTVYAFANNRIGGSADNSAETEVLVSVKRPGREFSSPRVIAARKDWSYMIGSAVCDDATGKVMCFFKKIAVVQHEFVKSLTAEERDRLARIKEERDGDLEGDYVIETLDGEVFTERRITIEPCPEAGSGFVLGRAGYSHGSGAGITVHKGRYKGRLVVPARMSLHETKTWEDLMTGSTNTTIYSDDHGETWKTGGIVEAGTGEGTLCERNDGSIYYNSRAYFNDGFRRSALSLDGGETFVSQHVQRDLIEPCCNAAVVRGSYRGKPVLFFSNPASTDTRIDMTVYYSFDDGASWTRGITIDHRPASYSCMCFDEKNGVLFLLYECGETDCVAEIDVAELTPEEIIHETKEEKPMLSLKFIAAGRDYAYFGHHVASPYLRKSFTVKEGLKTASVTVTGLGFYEIFINGERITKGALAPYINNPDDLIYYDTYDLVPYLKEGENVLGFQLGNGFINCFGGKIWDFDVPEQARFRGAPRLALDCVLAYTNSVEEFEADETFLTHPSPLLLDDVRCGEIYDARLELPGWNHPGYDASGWTPAISVETPRGEARICEADPILVTRELKPVSFWKGCISKWPVPRESLPVYPIDENEDKYGYIYDFGVNSAGNARLKIKGKCGQKVIMIFGELLDEDNNLDMRAMSFEPHAYLFRNTYILKGGEEEIFVPRFSYMGFRYCLVLGITEEQATEDLLTYEVMNSGFEKIGDFSCSDEIVNKLQKACEVADLANFYYFPTDCPHREKNGWTGDANLSAEQMLLNFAPEKSFREWMRSIRKAMNDEGTIPGVVPTAGWGFDWGNGPSWDAVLFYLPYYTWLYRGETDMMFESAHAMMRYLDYLTSKRDDKGLLHIGLGDWLNVGRSNPKAPLEVTDTLKSMHIAHVAEVMFGVMEKPMQKAFAHALFEDLKASARKYLLQNDGVTLVGNSQTGQAMAVAYGLFDGAENARAVEKLVDMIHKNNDKFDVGCIGIRVLFHVLSDYGYAELAYKLIVGPDYPSYGHWIVKENCTALFEAFQPEGQEPSSKNHHFFGDISHWFYRTVAGLRVNPFERDPNEIEIAPEFLSALSFARAEHKLPASKVIIKWQRKGEEIELTLAVPADVKGEIRLPEGWCFASGSHLTKAKAESGVYTLIKE